MSRSFSRAFRCAISAARRSLIWGMCAMKYGSDPSSSLAIATTNPTGAWTTQAARNLFLAHADQLASSRALVRDRGSQFIGTFDEIFRTEGFKIL